MEADYIHNTVYPVFLISKLFGLTTIKLSTFKSHIIGVLWTILYIIFYILCVINYVSNFNLHRGNQVWILNIVFTLNTFVRIGTLLTLTIRALFIGPKTTIIFERIIEIDKQLEGLKVNVNIQTSHKKICRLVRVIVGIQITHYVFYLILHYLYYQHGPNYILQDICYVIATTVATLNSGVVLYQFSLLVLLLKQRFHWINHHLLDFCQKYKYNISFK